MGKLRRYRYRVAVETRFDAAHRLRTLFGKGSAAEPAEPLHGHSWRVRAVIETDGLDADGIAVEFRGAQAALERVAGRFDHRTLNEVPPFDSIKPPTETVARCILEELAAELEGRGSRRGRRTRGPRQRVVEVSVREGESGVATCCAD